MIALAFCLLATPIAMGEPARPSPPAIAAARGAWNVGPFDNDPAAAWYLEFTQAPSWTSIQRALSVANDAGYIEVDGASVVVAAAAVVAASRDGGYASLPENGRVSIQALGSPPAGLAELALTALDRVEQQSELAELWADGDAGPWVATLEAIREGLR